MKVRRHLVAGVSAWISAVLLSGCGGSEVDARLTAAQTSRDLVSRAGYPGAVSVQIRAEGLDVAAAGVLKVAGAAAGPDDRFAVGSLTKSMTATLAAVLVQEGRIGWDSLMLDVLPELAPAARSEYRGVTLRDLLSHRSGLFAAGDSAQLAEVPELSGTPGEQRLQFLAWALAKAPSVQPGRQSQYSNGGFVAAGAMLERVGAMPYEALIQNKVFQPLGINATFGAAGADGLREAWGHTTSDGRTWTALDPQAPAARFPVAANPAGGVKLSGNELARYLQLHVKALGGATGLLITPASARAVHATVADGFALGWLVGADEKRRPLSFHNGSDDVSYYALMAVRMDAQGAAAVLVNAFGSTVETDLSVATTMLLP